MLWMIVGIYFLLGICWILFNIIKERSFDMSGIGVSNVAAYTLMLVLWFYWAYQELKK